MLSPTITFLMPVEYAYLNKRFGRNIAPIMSPVESNFRHRIISSVTRLSQIRCPGRNAQHAAAVGHHLLSRKSRPRMEHFRIGLGGSHVQAADWLSFRVRARVTLGCHHHADRSITFPA